MQYGWGAPRGEWKKTRPPPQRQTIRAVPLMLRPLAWPRSDLSTTGEFRGHAACHCGVVSSDRLWRRLDAGVARMIRPLRTKTVLLVLRHPCSDVFSADLLARSLAVGGGGGEAVPGDVDGGG